MPLVRNTEASFPAACKAVLSTAVNTACSLLENVIICLCREPTDYPEQNPEA